jgi:hypothetical protein
MTQWRPEFRPGETYRRVRIGSDFGRLAALVTDGRLPFPLGRRLVGDLAETLKRATAAGAIVLVDPFKSAGREAAIVKFPGGYIGEIHTISPP